MDYDLATGGVLIHSVNQPDVVVVGAGPAGSSAAIRLAQAGCAVTICESAIFPRRKVCGGCLSGDAVELLSDLIGDMASKLGTTVTRITFGIGSRSFTASGAERCRIVPRDRLDATLADRAEAAGATLRFGVRAELKKRSDGRFGIQAAGDGLRPRWVVWAAGLNGLVMQDDRKRQSCRRDLIGQAWSVAPTEACPPVGEVAMHWLRGGYVGLATVSHEQCLMALAVEKGIINRSGQWKALCVANPNEPILRAIDLPTMGRRLGTAGFPHRPRRVVCENLLLAGDAAGFEEPFSGEGIGQAMRSGLAAADAILSGESDDAIVRNYCRGLRLHRRVRRRTRWMSHMLRSGPILALADGSWLGLDGLGKHLLKHMHIKPVAKGG